MDVAGFHAARAADRLLGAPSLPALARINVLGHEEARLFLRHFAAEQNRWSVEQWEWTQLGIGLGLVLLLVFGTRPSKIVIGLCLLMFGIVLVDRFGLTPWIVRFGRELDFLPDGTPLPARFTTVRDTYSIMEVVKVSLGLWVAGLLMFRKPADPRMFARESEMEEEAASHRRLPK